MHLYIQKELASRFMQTAIEESTGEDEDNKMCLPSKRDFKSKARNFLWSMKL